MTARAPKKRTCARFGHQTWPAASFPEGHLCHPCLAAALALTGTCPGCGIAGRALPGLRDGVRICRDCAGITRDFSCLRCGTETGMARGSRRGLSRLCERCAVTWTAARLLDDGTGAIAAPLKPLAGALAGSASPAATLEWLGKPHIRELLTGLAAGKLPLTHEALDGWPRPRAVAYLRDLLVDCGVLPAADRQLREFGAWLDRRLEGVAGHPHLRLLDIPRQQPYTGQAITQQRRLDLLRRFATSTDIPIRPRAAACLILLYAQPLSRILRLSTADLTRDRGGQTWLRLGDPPSPVPPPFDALLRQLAATRHDHVPANHASHWLFPGRHAGQPAEYRSMAAQLRDHGLPLRTARISALRQLVLQVPAPVIAGALGFHHTTTRQHVNAGATWSRYAGGGDHQG